MNGAERSTGQLEPARLLLPPPPPPSLHTCSLLHPSDVEMAADPGSNSSPDSAQFGFCNQNDLYWLKEFDSVTHRNKNCVKFGDKSYNQNI